MFKKIIFLAIISLVISITAIAMAQDATNTTTGTVTTTQEETVTAQDLGVSDPTLLPDSKFYFLKNWKNTIQSVFTFGQTNKAELNLKIASEKLLEAQKLAEKTNNPQILEKATELYNKQVEKINANIDKFKGTATSSNAINKFLEKYANQQILQNKILDKLEGKVPSSTMEKMRQNRERHLEKFGQVMQKLASTTQARKQEIINKIKNTLSATTTIKQKLENLKEKMGNNATTTENIVGGDKDEHGCIGSAGYSWCEAKQKCLRTWEEKCQLEQNQNQVQTQQGQQ